MLGFCWGLDQALQNGVDLRRLAHLTLFQFLYFVRKVLMRGEKFAQADERSDEIDAPLNPFDRTTAACTSMDVLTSVFNVRRPYFRACFGAGPV